MSELITTEAPAWLTVLREQVALHGQRAVANEIGYSKALVSQVLSGKYSGDLHKVAQMVRGAYMGDTVFCPILGDLPLHQCLQYQARPYRPSNHQVVQLFRACRSGCEHSSVEVH